MAKKVGGPENPIITAAYCEVLKKETESLKTSSEIKLLKPLHKNLEEAIKGLASSQGSRIAFNHLASQLKGCKLIIKRRIAAL